MKLFHRRGTAVLAVAGLAAGMLAGTTPATASRENLVHRLGVVDTIQGLWHLEPAALAGPASFYYGDPGDVPFVGDWDCDQEETPGLYRQSDGFVYLRNSNTQGIADVKFFFGNPGDVPLAGDFDGDGCDTVSLYRPAEQRFYVINELGSESTGLGAADFDFFFGDPGDKPFVGDFDGDGIDTVGLHRESTGRVYFRNTLTTGVADSDFIYGDPGDRIIAGDWTADGTDTVGIYRPADNTFYLRYSNTPGIADETIHFAEGQAPVAGATPGDIARFARVPCAAPGDYSPVGTTVAASLTPTWPSNANGVFALGHSSSPACERTTIVLGDVAPSGGPAAPALSVPAGVVVRNFGPRINVEMPGIRNVVPSQTEEGLDYRPTFVVRDPGGDLYVDVNYFDNRLTRVSFVDFTPFIVIDTLPAPTDPGLALGPLVSGDGLFALRERIQLRPAGPGVEMLPIVVTGYGRPFEAFGDVTLREPAATPGAGAPATAVFTGTPFLGTVTGSTYGYGATDYLDAWGEFSFSIISITPQDYEIFVGELSPKDGSEVGLYHEFTVEP